MKKFIPIVFLFALLFSHFLTVAQESVALSDLYLKGKWKASCSVEVLDHVTIQNCELCKFTIDKQDKSKASVSEFEMEFGEDSITIFRAGKEQVISYKRDKDNHSITFNDGNKEYHFRMFLDDERRILEDADGMLIVLKKAE